ASCAAVAALADRDLVGRARGDVENDDPTRSSAAATSARREYVTREGAARAATSAATSAACLDQHAPHVRRRLPLAGRVRVGELLFRGLPGELRQRRRAIGQAL